MNLSHEDRYELIQLCKTIYEKDDQEMSKILDYESNYSRETPVWWYTRESCIFKLLNLALRSNDVDILYSFRSLVQGIYQQIDGMYRNGQSCTTAFRFQLMKKTEIERIVLNEQQFISINSFLSTTLDEDYVQFLFYLIRR